MSKIIQFPKKKESPLLTDKKLNSILDTLEPELRGKIDLLLTKLSDENPEVTSSFSVHLPAEATEEHVELVTDAFNQRQALISRLFTQLAFEKIKNEITEYVNS